MSHFNISKSFLRSWFTSFRTWNNSNHLLLFLTVKCSWEEWLVYVGRFSNIYHYMSCIFPFKQALAHLVTEKDLNEGRLYPSLSSIGDVSLKLAVKVSARPTHRAAEGLWGAKVKQLSKHFNHPNNLCVTDHRVCLCAQHGHSSPGASQQRSLCALAHLQHWLRWVRCGLVLLARGKHGCAVMQALMHWT